MYGMVNQAIEAMVTEKFGADKWERVKARAGVEPAVAVRRAGLFDQGKISGIGQIKAA